MLRVSISITQPAVQEGAEVQITEGLFLNLPPELRNRIYELAFADEELTEHAFGGDWPGQAPLTRVNRQLRSESLAVFYGINPLRLLVGTTRQQTACPKWLEAIAPHVKLIRRLEIRTCGHANRYVLERAQGGTTPFECSASLLSSEYDQAACRVALYGVDWLEEDVERLNRALRIGDTGAIQMCDIMESVFEDAKQRIVD
ncbi:hypothetical protein LTR36_001484 [Oleoguttula mirabilis]|uniref:Uncharacterized protein n=1 Tax=Oleoguttula mirabilis TaxID=1507867 RepID=A0AAV9JMG4_9PEZI|nr:hypothetical protein LTR36_001484 [Oleoguttula mirabilis]